VLEALAPARQILAGLGRSVSDAAPDLSGADEVFRTFRAFSFATFRSDVLAEHPELLGPNVTWNIQRGLELTLDDLSRATVMRAALAEQVSSFFDDFDLLACPVSQVAR
jgi:amidase